jgi:hypothetical protein
MSCMEKEQRAKHSGNTPALFFSTTIIPVLTFTVHDASFFSSIVGEM